MGADLITAMCPMEITRAEAKERLRRYKEDFVLDTLANAFCRDFETDEFGTEYEHAIEWVDGCIDSTYDYYEQGSRCVDVHRFRGITFMVSGGLSWGEEPSHTYEPMRVAQELELTVEMPELGRDITVWKT